MLSPSNGQWAFTQIYIDGFGWGYAATFNNLTIDAGGTLYGTELTTPMGCLGSGCKRSALPPGYLGAYVFTLSKGYDGWQLGQPAFWYNPVIFSTGGALAVDAHGNLYGTTYDCGKYDRGVVWQVSPY